MKRRNQLVGVLMVAMMLLGLAGCGKDPAESVSPAESLNPAESTDAAVTTEGVGTETAETMAPTEVTELSQGYGQVAMGGGGFVTGLLSTSKEDLYYARTDVGGAYRWDQKDGLWHSLSYDITEADRGLLGVDGFAVDPKDDATLVMICGTSYFSGGKTCVFVSHDYGKSFDRVDVTDMIKNHGNGMGRQNGERVAIDPNNSDIMFIGGRTGGMIKSTDGGKTWGKVEAFPVESTENGTGICAILFDGSAKGADGNTSRIYAAVSRKGECIYCSEDGGATWAVVSNLPTDFMPERLRMNANGEVLIAFADAEGPWNGKKGAAYKYNPKDQTATDISHSEKPVGDIIADPTNPDRMVSSTINIWSQQPNGSWGDEFYVTNDGGKTWSNILETMAMETPEITWNMGGENHTGRIEWIKDYAIHWVGCLAIDSVNVNKLLCVSGNGIFACDNIWDAKPIFYCKSQGVEETVPLDAVSIKGGPLVTAIGDYDGFIHENIFVFPDRFTTTVGTNSAIAVAGQNSKIMVRVGGETVLYTTDGGENWTKINHGSIEGKPSGGKIAVTADGKNLVWSPENGTESYVTDNLGETWSVCEGLRKGAYLIADPVNPDYIYAVVNQSFYVSKDGGKTFTATEKQLGNDIRCAVVPGKEGTVYTAGNMKGLLVSEDYGETFKATDTVSWCGKVSTGKGKSDDVPALYMWGRPKDAEEIGVYASFDQGATWVQMNESGVEFGGPGNGQFVVGDQNVFGRCYMSTVGLGLIYFQYTE